MEVITIDVMHDSLPKKNRIACIGFFDALHIAHQQLLDTCFAYDGVKTFITFIFDRDALIHKPTDQYILNRTQRIEIVEEKGFDEYIEIIFHPPLKNLSPVDFAKKLQAFGITKLICGFDFRFGKSREGDVVFLKQLNLFEVIEIPEVTLEKEKISSSNIKQAVMAGEMLKVSEMLGRHYCIRSKVVEGKKLGRTIGYPTANLSKEMAYYYPKVGVYFGYVFVEKQKYPAMISVGFNPTVEQLTTPVIEAHLLDFNKDIYNQVVDVAFVLRIRDEIKFSNLEALITQLKKDEQVVRELICA